MDIVLSISQMLKTVWFGQQKFVNHLIAKLVKVISAFFYLLIIIIAIYEGKENCAYSFDCWSLNLAKELNIAVPTLYIMMVKSLAPA